VGVLVDVAAKVFVGISVNVEVGTTISVGAAIIGGTQEAKRAVMKISDIILDFICTFFSNERPNGLAHLPADLARRDCKKSPFLPNDRRIPAPIAQHPGVQRREGGQVEPALGAFG
jgi:hypothetical protein